jgi:hypothetical protein
MDHGGRGGMFGPLYRRYVSVVSKMRTMSHGLKLSSTTLEKYQETAESKLEIIQFLENMTKKSVH